MKSHKCKQIEDLSVMKDSLFVPNEAGFFSIDAPPANNESFDEPPAERNISNTLLN